MALNSLQISGIFGMAEARIWAWTLATAAGTIWCGAMGRLSPKDVARDVVAVDVGRDEVERDVVGGGVGDDGVDPSGPARWRGRRCGDGD